MKKQIYNPIFPLNEYVPDGEPHVFGDRVYLYGSHDKENGDRFCMLDYTVWSAPVTDLSDWTCHGVTYKKSQDPRSQGKTPDKYPAYYAPDCVRGNDGRYYLYYFTAGPNVKAFGPLSVAVADKPEGPFEYLGDIRYKDGTPVLKYLTNDPAVINDNGHIYLYYGWGLGRDFSNKALQPLYRFVLSKLLKRSIKEIKSTRPCILDCAFIELEEDMITIKSEPKAVLSSKTSTKKGTQIYNHAFYEAPSIRKIGDTFYLIYSSGENNELAYATSKYPDKGFEYRGVMISNSDLGLNGNKEPKNNSGTIHGGIEYINGQWYVFYHRCTNNTDFSRQACAEPITIENDGTIKQVEITTQGLNGKPLEAKGKYPAAICCYLYNPNLKRKRGNGNIEKYPCVTFDGKDRIVHGMTKETKAVYKYFDLRGQKQLIVVAKGKGILSIQGNEITVYAENWQQYRFVLQGNGKTALTFEVKKGKIDLREIEFV